jgi:hypothetical protein
MTTRPLGRGRLVCTVLLSATLCVAPVVLAGCSSGSSDSATTQESSTQTSTGALAAPSDLSIDFSTGKFTFTANDENVGYYFLRVYPVKDGIPSDEYLVSSSRINGGDTGEKNGTIDTSKLAYGTYNFNLVSNAASGSGYDAPSPVTYTYKVGGGCSMETPEFLAIADGGTLELTLDFWTLSDWYDLQRMPQVDFNVYSDEACTQLVTTASVDASTIEPTVMMGPSSDAHIWPYDANGNHLYLSPNGESNMPGAITTPVELTPEVTIDSLDAGTYYVQAVAKGDDELGVKDSAPSSAVAVTIGTGAPTGDFSSATSTGWVDPEFSRAPQATAGVQTDRVGSPSSQSISGELVS